MSQRLYRDPQHGAVAGVCSGLADYFEVEVWVVRLVLVTGLIFASFLTFFAVSGRLDPVAQAR